MGTEPGQLRVRVAAAFAARDPGRARATAAAAVSAGVLASGGAALAIVDVAQSDKAFLAMAVFLSVQAGTLVTDSTAGARALTTALLIPTALLAILGAALISPFPPAAVIVFAALAGAAVWIRRFGPRASAIGAICFMSCFFTLILHPSVAQLPAFCAVAAIAVATQLAARLVLLLQRPRRQLVVLMREFRAGSAAAVRAASHPVHPAALRGALGRIDQVSRAITSWQESFRTENQIRCDEATLDALIFDARIDTEEACLQLVTTGPQADDPQRLARQRGCTHLSDVLSERAPAAGVAAATAWAADEVERGERAVDDLAVSLIARSILSHVRVRRIDLSRGSTRTSARAPVSCGGHRSAGTHRHTAGPRRPLVPWRQWQPTTRMAVQAMIAASLAAVVGEAISASRWYWAVMTAFIVFVGATTRGGILTRAVRRVTGTLLGIGVGVGAVALAQDHVAVLIAICGIGVFGMLYLGPLNYLYSAGFITLTLVAIYRMLGVLDEGVLELRLVETVSGAVIGVLSAYLILSASSRPALATDADAYLSALDRLLESADGVVEGREEADLLGRLHAVESAQAKVDQTLSATAAAFLTRQRAEKDAVRLMHIATRAAAGLVQAMGPLAEPGPACAWAAADDATADAIARARQSLAAARRVVHLAGGDTVTTEDGEAMAPPDGPAASAAGRHVQAITSLARMDWALSRLTHEDLSASGGVMRRPVGVAVM